MKLHELTSFLSSSDPADRLQGLEALEQVRGPAQLPVLVHLIHVCHPGIRETLLARVAGHEKPAIAQALGQLLESDAPHPESALFYLSMAGDPAYNGLMLSMLPQCAEPIQVGILQVLSRTADESTAITLAPLAPHLGSSARQAMARLLASLPTQKGAGTPPPSLPEDRYVNFSLTAPRALATGSSDLPAAPRAEAVAPHARDLEPQAEGPASKGEDREPAPSLGNRIAERHRRERLGVWAGRARELALRAGGFAVWMAALSLLARASWESLHLTGPMRFLTPAGLGAALFASLAGWRRLTHLDRAALAGITLAACAAAALQAAPGAPPAFALFGRGPGFWGNVMCLAATALVVFATLAQTEWPRMARLASIALAAYVALGFVRALAIGVPFESALVSGAWLPQVPFALLQPPAAFIDALLPAALTMALLHRLRGIGASGLRGPLGALAFLAIPLLACSQVFEAHLLPTPRTLAFGRSLGQGSVGIDYTSDWFLSAEGSGRHRVEVMTHGSVPGGRRRAYELAAALIPAPVAGKPTEVVVSVREARLGVNVARLSSGDLDVYEDGEKQTVASMALESDGGRPVYRLQYTRPLPPMASVHLTSPASGAQITGILNIVADAGSGTAPVGLRTDIYVDQEPIGCFDRLPARVTEPVEAFAAGKHVVRAVLRDRFGRVAEERCEVALRHSLPDLAVLQPSEGSALWGDAKLEVSAGGVQPRRVELMMDATVLKTFGGDTAPVQVASADLDSSALPADASVRIVGAARVYTAGFNARAVPEGLHRFGVRMLTADGRTLEKRVSARVVRPLVAVRFVTPAFRARLTGKVPLAAEAVCSWPELGVARMEFTANGKRLGIVEHAPYVYQWDTSGWAPGRYRIDAVAAASSGDVGSAAVFVEVTRPDAAAALEGAFDGMTLASPAVLHAVVIGPGGSRVQRLACLVDGHTAASGGAGPLAVRLDPAAHGEGDADVAVEAVLVDGKKIGRTYRVHMAPSRRPSTWACALRHGAPVPFAELPAPEVLVDSVPARGLRIRPAATAPASWALVVDVSASMAAAERQASLKEAAGKFIEGLGREDRVALFVFNDEVTLARPFSTDKDGVLEALSNARAYGATALNDAVYRAAEALGHEPGRRVAVLVTDGVDQNIDWTGPASTHLLPQAVAMARSAGVVVHAIGLGRELRQENALGERLLARLSAETGGLYQYAPWTRDLSAAFGTLSRQIAAESEVSWDASESWGERLHTVALSWPGRLDFSARVAPEQFGM